MECQLREGYEIFLISSAHCTYQALRHAHRFLSNIQYIYMYCSRTDYNGNWTKYYRQIRGVYNHSDDLANALKRDLDQLKESRVITYDDCPVTSSSAIDQQVSSILMKNLFFFESFILLDIGH